MSDLVRKQDAVTAISDLLLIQLQGKRLPTWNEVYNAINGIPSAEPEQKKGEWKYSKNEAGHDGYFCSECETFIPWYYEYYHSAVDMIFDYKFCPNCGAEMRGEDENA